MEITIRLIEPDDKFPPGYVEDRIGTLMTIQPDPNGAVYSGVIVAAQVAEDGRSAQLKIEQLTKKSIN